MDQNIWYVSLTGNNESKIQRLQDKVTWGYYYTEHSQMVSAIILQNTAEPQNWNWVWDLSIILQK
jgi:hypothetical protein